MTAPSQPVTGAPPSRDYCWRQIDWQQAQSCGYCILIRLAVYMHIRISDHKSDSHDRQAQGPFSSAPKTRHAHRWQKRGWAFDYVITLCDKARQECVILPEAREI